LHFLAAVVIALGFDFDVRRVSYGTPSEAILQMAKDFDLAATEEVPYLFPKFL
jgi:hypothetical protein